MHKSFKEGSNPKHMSQETDILCACVRRGCMLPPLSFCRYKDHEQRVGTVVADLRGRVIWPAPLPGVRFRSLISRTQGQTGDRGR